MFNFSGIRTKCGDDGAALVNLLHGIAMDEEQPTRFRLDAMKILLERGFGKPPQEVHVKTGGLSDVTPEQVQLMSDADLKRFLALTTEACELVEGAQQGAPASSLGPSGRQPGHLVSSVGLRPQQGARRFTPTTTT